MFRHERPQAGRYRQFHQIGVEAFGMAGPDIDAEIILMTAALWRALGLADQVTLELNTLGNADDRKRHRDDLVAYLAERRDQLDADSQRRLERNPLRILDSKDDNTQRVLENAPRLADYLGEDARAHFDGLRELLDAAGIEYRINPSLVRGLDYYGKTVFEWVTDALGAQGTVCAGGRYDGLVGQLGGRETPAVGFAMGLERLVWLLARNGTAPADAPDVYIIAPGAAARALTLADELRNALPGRRVLTHCGGGSFKSQMKKADKSGAQLALILGASELERGEAQVKPMRGQGEPEQVALDGLAARLRAWLS
jgi:histidyl-tRNA synthetase